MLHHPIENVIFDLGNVIVDLNMPRAEAMLQELAGLSFMHAKGKDLEIFLQFESGLISEAIFLNYILGKSPRSVQALDIIRAWNAMLGDIPLRRLQMMKELQDRYRVFILSNTNETHIRYTRQHISTHYGASGFEAYVHHPFYSHDLKCRKPDAIIYEKVMEHAGIEPATTLFFDDHPDNIAAAQKAGIQAMLVDPNDEIIDIIEQVLPEDVAQEKD